jgi:hypothetical protein
MLDKVTSRDCISFSFAAMRVFFLHLIINYHTLTATRFSQNKVHRTASMVEKSSIKYIKPHSGDISLMKSSVTILNCFHQLIQLHYRFPVPSGGQAL